jgi:uncharacterized protein YcfL
MKKVLLVIFAVLLLVGCSNPPDIKTAVSREVVIYTTEIKESAIMRKETESEFIKFFERLLKREIILPVHIHIKAAVYCSKIDKDKIIVNDKNKTVELTLPEPEFVIDGTRVDWDNAEVYVGTLRKEFSSEEVEKFAKEAVEQCKENLENNKQEYIVMAKQNAEKAVSAIIESFGYKAIINY